MIKDSPIYIGSYNTETNDYKIEPLASLCELNSRFCKTGFAGYAPICFGSSEDEVRKNLESFKEEKRALFMKFESAMVDYVSAFADESCDVHIEPADGTSEEESYLDDGITIIPDDMKGRPFPVASLAYYYRMFYGNPMNVSNVQEAIEYVAQDAVNTLMEMWEDPQECSFCNSDSKQ